MKKALSLAALCGSLLAAACGNGPVGPTVDDPAPRSAEFVISVTNTEVQLSTLNPRRIDIFGKGFPAKAQATLYTKYVGHPTLGEPRVSAVFQLPDWDFGVDTLLTTYSVSNIVGEVELWLWAGGRESNHVKVRFVP